MNTRNTYTWRILAVFFILFAYTQSGTGQDRTLTREEKKEVRKTMLAANYNTLDSMLTKQRFVLVAEWLRNNRGDRAPVTGFINFIKVDGNNCILQTGSNSIDGTNGVGGTTAEGTLSGWELSRNVRSKTFTLRFNVTTQIGHYDILMLVSAGNKATATITGLTPGSLTWEGHLETVSRSNVFKGRNTI